MGVSEVHSDGMELAVNDHVFTREDGPGYEGTVIRVLGRRVTVAWPVPGRRGRYFNVAYDRDELLRSDDMPSGAHFNA